jgi:hypothetical protein
MASGGVIIELVYPMVQYWLFGRNEYQYKGQPILYLLLRPLDEHLAACS